MFSPCLNFINISVSSPGEVKGSGLSLSCWSRAAEPTTVRRFKFVPSHREKSVSESPVQPVKEPVRTGCWTFFSLDFHQHWWEKMSEELQSGTHTLLTVHKKTCFWIYSQTVEADFFFPLTEMEKKNNIHLWAILTVGQLVCVCVCVML